MSENSKLQLANHELVSSLTARCYSTRVGERVTLVIMDKQIACFREDSGIPRTLWREYLRQKKSTGTRG